MSPRTTPPSSPAGRPWFGAGPAGIPGDIRRRNAADGRAGGGSAEPPRRATRWWTATGVSDSAVGCTSELTAGCSPSIAGASKVFPAPASGCLLSLMALPPVPGVWHSPGPRRRGLPRDAFRSLRPRRRWVGREREPAGLGHGPWRSRPSEGCSSNVFRCWLSIPARSRCSKHGSLPAGPRHGFEALLVRGRPE